MSDAARRQGGLPHGCAMVRGAVRERVMNAAKRALDEGTGRQKAKPRRDCVRDAVASVRIEGGQVDDDAVRILDRWAEGALPDEAMMAEILTLHVQQGGDTCPTPLHRF